MSWLEETGLSPQQFVTSTLETEQEDIAASRNELTPDEFRAWCDEWIDGYHSGYLERWKLPPTALNLFFQLCDRAMADLYRLAKAGAKRETSDKKIKRDKNILKAYSDVRHLWPKSTSIHFLVKETEQAIETDIDDNKSRKYGIKKREAHSYKTIQRVIEPEILKDYPYLKNNKKSLVNEA